MTGKKAQEILGNTDSLTVTSNESGYHLYTIDHDRRVVLALDYEITGINTNLIPEMVKNYAHEAETEKICVRIPGHIAPAFIALGYQVEASVPEYYCNGEPMLIMSQFLTARRALASRVQHEAGYNLEIQYRFGQAAPIMEANLVMEEVSPENQEMALDYYLAQSSVVSRQDLQLVTEGKPQVVFVRQGEQIYGVGALLIENAGRVARVQGLITVNSDEVVARALINHLWHWAERQGVTCLYSITSTLDEVINRVLPAVGFSFRGKLGADTISDGQYADRYVWSRSL
ncbi:MAG: hypothetical protein ACM3O9_02610 [Methylocystaceae bacterium]